MSDVYRKIALTVSIVILWCGLFYESPYVEVWQTTSSFESSGRVGWNGTIVMACEQSIWPYPRCSVIAFQHGQDYVGPFHLTRTLATRGLNRIKDTMYQTDQRWEQWNSTEICLYGGCYGVYDHADVSACDPKQRWEWRLFGGCKIH